MRSPKDVNSYFSKFNKIIGNNKLALIHFNDSAKKLGSNVDRHANIGEGYIGNPDLDGNIDGLKAVFKKASKSEGAIPDFCVSPPKLIWIKIFIFFDFLCISSESLLASFRLSKECI